MPRQYNIQYTSALPEWQAHVSLLCMCAQTAASYPLCRQSSDIFCTHERRWGVSRKRNWTWKCQGYLMPDPRDPAHSTVGFMSYIYLMFGYSSFISVVPLSLVRCKHAVISESLNRFSVKFHGNKTRYKFRDEKNKKSKQYLKIWKVRLSHLNKFINNSWTVQCNYSRLRHHRENKIPRQKIPRGIFKIPPAEQGLRFFKYVILLISRITTHLFPWNLTEDWSSYFKVQNNRQNAVVYRK